MTLTSKKTLYAIKHKSKELYLRVYNSFWRRLSGVTIDISSAIYDSPEKARKVADDYGEGWDEDWKLVEIESITILHYNMD